MKSFAIAFCLALAMTLGSGAGHVVAQDQRLTRSELIDTIARTYDEQGTRDRLQKQGFTGKKLELAVDHEKRLITDQVVMGYIADRLLALYDGNLPRAWAPEGLTTPLFENGFTRLSASEMKFYFQIQLAILRALPPRDCGLLIKGRMSEQRSEKVIGTAEARLSEATLDRYFKIIRKAMRTGVQQSPRLLSPQDDARIQELINKTLRERIENDPALARVGGAFGNIDGTSAANACLAGTLFYDVVLGLKGRNLEHGLLYLHAL